VSQLSTLFGIQSLGHVAGVGGNYIHVVVPVLNVGRHRVHGGDVAFVPVDEN
jgi:hypothetical protein